MDYRIQKIAWMLLAIGLVLSVAGCGRRVEQTGDSAELISEGWKSYRLNEFQNAMLAFEAAVARAEAGSDEWAMATYGLATTWDLRRPSEDRELATELYEGILATSPDGPMAPWTELALVRQKHLVPVGVEPDYEAVTAGYQHLIEKFPDHLAAKEAFLYLQSIELAKLDPKSSAATAKRLKQFIADQDIEFVGPAWSLLAVAYTTLGNQIDRFKAEQNSFDKTEVDPSDPYLEFAWAYWNLATIAEFEVGDFDSARTYYELLIETYPNDIRVYGCKQALKRMDALEAKIRAEEEAKAL